MYEVVFVDDQAMPDGHDFVLVQAGEDHVLFYREGSTASRAVLQDSWAAYRALRDEPDPQLRLRSAS